MSVDIRARFERVITNSEKDTDKVLVDLIDMFDEVADSYEHDIYDHTIIRLMNEGTNHTVKYIENLDKSKFSIESLQLLYDIKDSIKKRLNC
ncbi:MAG: hypothetical protein ACK5L5_03210 [Bacteroidales bacterium]